MLNIQFKRNSEPITDAELISVIEGIRPAVDCVDHPDRDYALLLAKMLFRIRELQAQVAELRKPPKPPYMQHLADSLKQQNNGAQQ
jgi:hypothetical protein